MPYLYPLLGVSIWIAVVGLSSNTLISFENKKQLESVKSFTTRTADETKKLLGIYSPQSQIITETVQRAPVTNQTFTAEPAPLKDIVKPVVQQKVEQEDRNSDEGEEEYEDD